MTTRNASVAALGDEALQPEYWLVSGLDWPAGERIAEAAVAVAPTLIPRDALSPDAYQVLGCADLYARKHKHRVIFFSDLTRMFADAGTSWTELGVDWERALNELHAGSFPAVFLTISERVYHCICNPASEGRLPVRGASEEPARDDREVVRAAMVRQLSGDWPAYLQALIDTGRVAVGHGPIC